MDETEKIERLKKWGSSPISYSILQKGLCDYYNASGLVSYANYLTYNFVLGDPICPEYEKIDFLQEVITKLKFPAFVQVQEDTARLLHDKFRYKINQLGIETSINIQTYSLLNDTKKTNVRAFIRKGNAQSKVYELTQEELRRDFNITIQDMVKFSEEWLSGKTKKKDLRFLIRNIVYEDEPFVRKFYSITQDGKLMGFVFFNPIFKEDRIIGYCADMMRSSKESSKGHIAYVIFSAIEKFKQEKKDIVSLGLSPCANLTYSDFRQDHVTFYMLKMFYYFGNKVYNFKGINEHKRQYQGLEYKVYSATHRTFPWIENFAINKYIGIV